MLCVPTARLLVLHVAVFVLPLPLSATALQPVRELPPSVKFTLPVGVVPVTVAVKVTFVPTVAGVDDVASVVVLGAWLPLAEYTTVNFGRCVVSVVNSLELN